MSLSIRSATLADLAALLALHREAFGPLADTEATLRDQISSTTVATMQGMAVAGAVVIRDKEIRSLAVARSVRGQGIGSKLLEHALKKGTNRLYVQPENRGAVQLYERHGFRFVADDVRIMNGVEHVRMERIAADQSQEKVR